MPPHTLQLVDPQLLPLLQFFPPLELTADSLPALRSKFASPPDDPRPSADVEVVAEHIAGPAGAPGVNVIRYVPRGRGPMPCVLHIHGGGYVVGSAASMTPVHRALAEDAGCIIVSVDYRLAPETRFPGAVEDCYAALSWVHAHADRLGVDARRVGVLGESAGGGLAAALSLLARDRGEYPLAFQHLIAPMLDDRTAAATVAPPYAGEFLWTPHNNRFGWSALLGAEPGSDGVSPYAAAARATDLAGLPAAFIAVGALDLFLDENMDYARRLMRHGVPVEFHVYPGAFHAFELSADARVAVDARRDRVAALRRALGHG